VILLDEFVMLIIRVEIAICDDSALKFARRAQRDPSIEFAVTAMNGAGATEWPESCFDRFPLT